MIQLYKETVQSLTHREKAEQEVEIWNLLSDIHGAGITKRLGERRDWMVREFGGKPSDYEKRAALYRAGPWAHELFKLVDSGEMTINVAAKLCAIARGYIRTGAPPQNAITRVLKEHRGGKSFSRVNAGLRNVEKTVSPSAKSQNLTKEFIGAMKSQAEQYVTTMVNGVGVEEVFVERMVRDFVGYVQESCNELKDNINKAKADARKERSIKIGKDRFNYACEVLGLTAKFGKAIDLKEANKLKKLRARELSPDFTGGAFKSEQQKNEYHAVLEAYEILETYVGQRDI